ncbi:MAG: metal ABC transporter permease [SAR324 cluster bacterium]|nr:metal ABC transporter permease [SAR324 cluster bacterium]
MAVIDYFLEPLSYAFMQRAMLVSVLIGVVCAIFSCFLVVKRWSLMGDAVSHAVLPGMAIALLMKVPIAVGAFLSGLFCALTTGYLKQNSRIKEDALMGIVFSGMFAVGLIMLTKIETNVHLLHILFGNVLGISQRDIWEVALISGGCGFVMLIKRRDFMFYCFDPIYATVVGLSNKKHNFALLSMLALTIVAAMKVAGIILVMAMLITPGATGLLVSKSFDKMMLVSVGTSVISCLLGVIFSFHFDAATAPLIVLMQIAFFLVSLLSIKAIAYKKRFLSLA